MKFAFKYDIGTKVQNSQNNIIGYVIGLAISRHRTVWVDVEYIDTTGKVNTCYFTEEELEFYNEI